MCNLYFDNRIKTTMLNHRKRDYSAFHNSITFKCLKYEIGDVK